MVVVTYYHSLTGHVAISLTGLEDKKNIHLSIYPTNRKTLAESKAYFRLHGLALDGPACATEIIILPSEESCGYGLSENAIYNWWENKFDPANEYYGLFSTNCASLVYRALEAGQLHSKTFIDCPPLKLNFWVPRPWAVLLFARELGKHLFEKHPDIDDEIFLKWMILKELCKPKKDVKPYDHAMVLFFKIKQFDNDKYSLLANKPFCEGVRSVMETLQSDITEKKDTDIYNQLATLTDTSTLTINMIGLHFDKLRTVADFIYGIKEKILHDELLTLFNKAIKKQLLCKVHDYLNTTELYILRDKERINHAFTVAGQRVDDKNNPHFPFIQEVQDIPWCYFGLT